MPRARSAPAWTTKVTVEERGQLGDLPGSQLQCLFILQAGARHGTDWVPADEIARALQHLGIALSATGVRNTLDAAARARVRLVSRSTSRPRSYRIAQPGERALAAALGGNIEVVRIEADKPRTARVRLAQMLGELDGVVRISDPYYGARSADALAGCVKAREVRLITGRCGGGEKEPSVRRALVDVTVEHRNVQVRVAPTARLPHDRYVLTDREMIIVGHGLKDLGSRESFVIRFPRSLLADAAAQIEATFDALWLASAPIKV